MTRVFRFAPWTIKPDPLVRAFWEAECVSGESEDCGAESRALETPEAVDKWMCSHTEATGHTRFIRMSTDYLLTEPPEGSVAAQRASLFTKPQLEVVGGENDAG
ncbi:hypothetical protein LKL35_29250 [Streptomyces sp. ET3-23]|uniref:DUF7848 domain-containing protein n=1 Tax=Streptomyces sp. ET3-23 TaxID=2885643 RepID=UPI001D1048C9|nr:hypothetical protein [Streptomyces sp. ET3-23]MCC2279486.1 hypothetical protein [Streptomyces sp. ET3-23]